MTAGPKAAGGFTLVELVLAVTILGLVSLVPAYTIVESMKVYGRTVPLLDAAYQARFAVERMKRDLRDLKDTDSIATMSATSLAFIDLSDRRIVYELSSGNLLRDGDPLARGVTALAFSYWTSDGTPAAAAADVHLFEVDLTVTTGGQSYRSQTAVFPRVLSPHATSGASPIALFALDETTGTTATDTIAGNDGTLMNGVVPGAAGAPSGNFAATFDGADDYIEVPHSSAYLLDNGTIQLWFRADDVSGLQALISKDSSGYDTGGHVRIYLNGDDVEVRFQSTTADHTLAASSVVTPETWHHVAFTFGAAGMRLYVDGALRDADPYAGGMGSTSGGAGNSEPIAIGADTYYSDDGVVTPLRDYFAGRIDAVAIFGAALDADDVLALYAAGGAIE